MNISSEQEGVIQELTGRDNFNNSCFVWLRQLNCRMNPTKTAYMVYYRDTSGSGYQWSEQALTRELGQEIVDAGAIVERRVLTIPADRSYITVEPGQTAESYTAGLRQKYITALVLAGAYILLYVVRDFGTKEKEDGEMSRQKTRWIFLLALSVLVAVLLSGCQFGEKYPFYPMEKCEDNSEILYMDGVQYVRKQEWDEHAHYRKGGYQYVWTPAEGIGEQIGVCGDEDTQYAALNIYEVVGDEEHIFLYTWPAHFYFGGVETYLWMQDGITLGKPTVEMVSSVTVVSNEEEETSAQVDDPAMIAALLETYNGDSIQVPNSEDWVYGSLIMHHKDFPFLQYEIEYRYSLELEISYCQNKKREWLLLPAEWYAIISEHDFPTKGE